MILRCKIDHEFFNLLGNKKLADFRQFEEITFESNQTGEKRTFRVDDVYRLDVPQAITVRKRYANIPWDLKKPIFCIMLGPEINKFVGDISPAALENLDKVDSQGGRIRNLNVFKMVIA